MNAGGFSWKRLLGISAFKTGISRSTGIPLTRTGRERKLGAAMGPLASIGILLIAGSRMLRLLRRR
jgi:hypothetical protein